MIEIQDICGLNIKTCLLLATWLATSQANNLTAAYSENYSSKTVMNQTEICSDNRESRMACRSGEEEKKHE